MVDVPPRPRPRAWWLALLLAGCLDPPERTDRHRLPPDAAFDAGRDEAGVALPPCDPATDPVVCCRPRDDRAPCCAPPDVEQLTCPEGATEERPEDGSFTCKAPGTDGIIRAVGPFVAFFGGRVTAYGTIEDGGLSYQCDPTTGRMLQMRRHSTWNGDPSPGRIVCSLACWDEGGAEIACETPCAR